jgi:sugar O-acyltransferase (sialic acid O-acetyltransferase NeuD family)
MKKPEIILVGGGGHCKSCIEVIESAGIYHIKGIIDLPNLLGSKTMGYPVIGNDDDLPQFIEDGYSFLITMGHMGIATRRNLLFEKISDLGGSLPIIVASSAYVSKSAQVEQGTIIMHQSMINAKAIIGENCIINTKTLIEHDSKIGDHCHISTGAVINGDCKIERESFIGSGTVIKNGISVKSNTLIGAGSLVINDIEVSGTYYGSPVKKQK